MLASNRMTLFLLLASSWVPAQLVVENPKHLDLPEPQAQVLLRTTARLVEQEFHRPGALENKFHLRLVLGQTPEHFTVDDPAGGGAIYLERWDEGKFALATMQIAIQRLLPPERQQQVLQEILRRARGVAPVDAARLRKEDVPGPQLDASPLEDECVAAIANMSLRGRPCGRPRPLQVR